MVVHFLLSVQEIRSQQVHESIEQHTVITCYFTIKLDMNFDYLFRSSYMPV